MVLKLDLLYYKCHGNHRQNARIAKAKPKVGNAFRAAGNVRTKVLADDFQAMPMGYLTDSIRQMQMNNELETGVVFCKQ
eukprot:2963320-Amphidinium_carterae.1